MTPMRKRIAQTPVRLFIGLSLIVLTGIPRLLAGQAPVPPSDKKPPLPPAAPVALTLLKPDATIPVPGGFSMAVTSDGLWITDPVKNTLIKVDEKTNAAGAPIGLPGKPCGSPLSAFRTIWIALCDGQQILRVATPPTPPSPTATPTPSPTSTPTPTASPTPSPGATPVDPGPAQMPVPGKPITLKMPGGVAGMLATGSGSVWALLSTKGTIARIDPDTNTVVAEISVLAGANAMTFANDALWLVSTAKGVVTRVNGNSNVVMKAITVGKSPVAIASGAGSLWVLNAGDATISRIDPAAEKVAETIKLGVTTITPATGAMAFAEGSLWVSVPGTPLARIDPATNRVVQRFTGAGGGMLAAGLKSLWLAGSATTLLRIDPKRAEATR